MRFCTRTPCHDGKISPIRAAFRYYNVQWRFKDPTIGIPRAFGTASVRSAARPVRERRLRGSRGDTPVSAGFAPPRSPGRVRLSRGGLPRGWGCPSLENERIAGIPEKRSPERRWPQRRILPFRTRLFPPRRPPARQAPRPVCPSSPPFRPASGSADRTPPSQTPCRARRR